MSDLLQAVRCGDCEQEYSYERNMLTDEMVWVRPKRKRAIRCEHPTSSVQWLGPDGVWRKPGEAYPDD